MNQMPSCPKCGAQLPQDAPAGLCRKCLVQAGFESENPSQPELERTAASKAPSGFEPPAVEDLAKRFSQLEILELLGKGGMGAVYKARQPGLDRLVAVKILPVETSHDPTFAERFTREARALARLSHPNIVAIYDFGQTEGLYFFVMEYVDGVDGVPKWRRRGSVAAVQFGGAPASVSGSREDGGFSLDLLQLHREVQECDPTWSFGKRFVGWC